MFSIKSSKPFARSQQRNFRMELAWCLENLPTMLEKASREIWLSLTAGDPHGGLMRLVHAFPLGKNNLLWNQDDVYRLESVTVVSFTFSNATRRKAFHLIWSLKNDISKLQQHQFSSSKSDTAAVWLWEIKTRWWNAQ